MILVSRRRLQISLVINSLECSSHWKIARNPWLESVYLDSISFKSLIWIPLLMLKLHSRRHGRILRIMQESRKFLSLARDWLRARSIMDNIESPFLKDVTAPLGKIVTQIRSGNFDIDAAIHAAKVFSSECSRFTHSTGVFGLRTIRKIRPRISRPGRKSCVDVGINSKSWRCSRCSHQNPRSRPREVDHCRNYELW